MTRYCFYSGVTVRHFAEWLLSLFESTAYALSPAELNKNMCVMLISKFRLCKFGITWETYSDNIVLSSRIFHLIQFPDFNKQPTICCYQRCGFHGEQGVRTNLTSWVLSQLIWLNIRFYSVSRLGLLNKNIFVMAADTYRCFFVIVTHCAVMQLMHACSSLACQ